MAIPFFDLTQQYGALQSQLEEALRAVVRSQQFTLGESVERLEAELAEYVGVEHAVGCASGTDALLLPLRAWTMGSGGQKAWHSCATHEVVVPAFTFFATAGAVWNAGLRPVFCDVDPETFNVTRETVEAAWTERTRGVIPVHLFGQMAPVQEVGKLVRARGGFLLEDAPQAIGAAQCRTDSSVGSTGGGEANAKGDGWLPHGEPSTSDGVKAGAVGDAGAFSFYPTKNLGGFGEGGFISTNDSKLADQLRRLRVHGAGAKRFHHGMVGTNSRLDALQATVLSVKLPHLESWHLARRRNAECYGALLEDVAEVITPTTAPGNSHVYNQYTIRARRRDELRDHLSKEGVGSAVYYPVPLHLQTCFAELGYQEGRLPVSESLCREVLSLPIFPELGIDRVEAVAEAVRGFYR